MIPDPAPTKITHIEQLADLGGLFSAWLTVRQSATKSLSLDISKAAKTFEVDQINNLKTISQNIADGTYAFDSAIGSLKKRPGKSPRPLVIGSIKDRIVQRAILNLIWQNASLRSTVQTPYSFGGIEDRSVKIALLTLKQYICQGFNYFITSDIKNFFPTVNKDTVHAKIVGCLADNTINHLLEQAVSCELSNAASPNIRPFIHLFPKDEIGVIQGCCLSPLYGNIYLSEFDKQLNKQKTIRCLRYIDDFIIIGKRERYKSPFRRYPKKTCRNFRMFCFFRTHQPFKKIKTNAIE